MKLFDAGLGKFLETRTFQHSKSLASSDTLIVDKGKEKAAMDSTLIGPGQHGESIQATYNLGLDHRNDKKRPISHGPKGHIILQANNFLGHL